MPTVEGRLPLRGEPAADEPAGDGAQGNRRIGRPKRRRADLRDRPADRLGDDAQRREIARLALVCAHARRGVALDVLHGAVALAHGEGKIVDGDVGLQIDERFGARRAGRRRRNAPDRQRCRQKLVPCLGRRPGRGDMPCLGGGLDARRVTVRQGIAQAEDAGGGTDRSFGLDRPPRHEGADRAVINRLAAGLGGQVDRRRPAAGHAQRVTGDDRRTPCLVNAAALGQSGDMDGAQPPAALGGHDGVSAQHRQAGGFGLASSVAAGAGP